MATLTDEWRATGRSAPSLVNGSGGIFNPGAWFFQQNNTPLPTDKYIIIKGHDTFFSIWYYDISEFQLYSTIYGDNNTRRREVLVCLQSSTLVLVPILYLVPDTVEFLLLSSIVCVTVCWYAVDGVDGCLGFITPWQWKIECNICKALTLLRLKRAKSTMNKQYKYQSNILMRTVMLLADENYVISVSQVVKKWREKVKTIHARNQQREKKSESTLRRFN